MSGHVIPHPALSRAVGARPGIVRPVGPGAARATFGTWFAALARMTRAVEERRLLATLDDRMLADIGVSRSEAAREANRASWDLGAERS